MSKSLLRTDGEITEIYERHHQTVYRVCFAYMKQSADTENAVHDTFCQLIRTGTPFENEAHERAWLIRTATNLCKNALRNRWRKQENLEAILMKNERIIDAWNKIGPDGGAAARMLGAILAYNHSVRAEKRGAHPEYRGPGRKRAIPIAVCLVAVLALTAAFGSNAGWFDRRVHTADLGNGNVLNFYKTDALGATGMDLGDVTSRELTTAENQILFGELPVTSYATFSATDKTLMRVEGNIEIKTGNAGSAKVILAAPGIPVTDTSIDADREISEVNGVPVSAGYFVTDTNSRGFSDMIYIASFAMDGVSAYLALGGAEAESEALRHVIAGMIEQLIRNGAPDLSAITE